MILEQQCEFCKIAPTAFDRDMLEVEMIFNVLPNHAEIVGTKETTGKEKGKQRNSFYFCSHCLSHYGL
jgi:hypothetical protein